MKEVEEEFPNNFEFSRTGTKNRNAAFYHGDHQTSIDYKSNAEHLLIGMGSLGRFIKINQGSMDRSPESKPPEASLNVADGYMKTISGRMESGDIVSKNVTFAKNLADTFLSPKVWPAEKVAKAIYETLKEQDPVALEGTKTIFIGHYHPPGHPQIEHEGITFIFTGPATKFSSNPAYVAEINDDRGYENINAVELNNTMKFIDRVAKGVVDGISNPCLTR